VSKHWVTHPKNLQCVNGHCYSHPKNSGMSLYFGDKGVLTMSLVCHRCQPATYCFCVVYAVKPIPLAFCYGVEDKTAFSELQRMDEQEVPLEKMLEYLGVNTRRVA
jgi:hypothetical protein